MRGAPIPPAEYDGEHLDTDEKLEAAGWAAGLDVWEQVGKGYSEWYLKDDTLGNAQLWSLPWTTTPRPVTPCAGRRTSRSLRLPTAAPSSTSWPQRSTRRRSGVDAASSRRPRESGWQPWLYAG
jgi:hypothetical protein